MKELIDVPTLAKQWGLKESWIYQNVNSLPHHKLGHLVRFDPDELEQYLGQTRRGPQNGGVTNAALNT